MLPPRSAARHPLFIQLDHATIHPRGWLFALQVWRNHAGLVEALLEAGADPDAQDSESGWSALHRALHWGQLRIAAALLGANASLALPDWRGRSPLDLLSAELKEYVEPGGDGDVFSWGGWLCCGEGVAGGSGCPTGTCGSRQLLHWAACCGSSPLHCPLTMTLLITQSTLCPAAAAIAAPGAGNGSNYTLGTGSTDLQLHPARIDSLHDQQVVAVSAAKFHSAAVSVDGQLLTWGWGRGGRLGEHQALGQRWLLDPS